MLKRRLPVVVLRRIVSLRYPLRHPVSKVLVETLFQATALGAWGKRADLADTAADCLSRQRGTSTTLRQWRLEWTQT
jgi:hypothetical protein